MLLSIRKIFSNIKISLLILTIGIVLLTVQLFMLTTFSARLSELRNQHLLIDKVINIDSVDPQMTSITVNGFIAQINLSVKLSSQSTMFESFTTSSEQLSPLRSALEASSERFQHDASTWAASLKTPQNAANREHMLLSRVTFASEIAKMSDYNILILDQSIATAKIMGLFLLLFSCALFFRYRYRLTQIYADIDKACALDTNGEQKIVHTKEIDFILKRLIRRPTQSTPSISLTHPLSGLKTQKGLMTAFNAKKLSRANNTVFLAAFEIDQYEKKVASLSNEDNGNLFRKLGEIIALHEQPLDVTAHLEDDHIVLAMSRSNKQIAIEDCEKILHSVEESGFSTVNGIIKITLSGGFLLKIPVKTIDEAIEEAVKLVGKAKESGGNRIAQLRDRADSYH